VVEEEERGITGGHCTLISFFSFRLKHAQITSLAGVEAVRNGRDRAHVVGH